VYVIPLILILMIALAIFFSPLFALIIAALFLIGLGIYKFLGRGTEPESAPPHSHAERTADEEETGPWGEQWPEQRSGQEPS
jgi:hypothetical protein